jgi:GMP synthase (glutamine-hydrolysing)
VRVLSVVHGNDARTSLFETIVRSEGHELEEWSLAWGTPPPRPIDDYDAVLVFGGAMHADQDDRHPWLREENMFLQRLLDRHVPMLGVCLGAQLIAKAAHASVYPASEAEIGWYDVELTDAASEDEVFSRLPRRFRALEWHYYTFDLPAGAVELAQSERCTQAFRLGDAVWAVQFHPEVTEPQLRSWLADKEFAAQVPGEEIAAETTERIVDWNDLGRLLCTGWLAAAGRAAVTA